MEALEKAIELAGGVTKLASAIGVAQNVVSNWRARGQAPAERCIAIEFAVGGGVTRYQLRPDVFGDPPTNLRPRPAARGDAAGNDSTNLDEAA